MESWLARQRIKHKSSTRNKAIVDSSTRKTPAQACKDRMKQQRQPTDSAERTKMQVYSACVTVTSRLHPSGNGSWKRASIRSFNFRCHRRILGIVQKVRFPINTQVPDQLKLQFRVCARTSGSGGHAFRMREGGPGACLCYHMHDSILVQLYVPTALCSHSSMFQHLYVPNGLYSQRSIFLQLCVPTAKWSSSLCSHSSIFPHFYVPTVVCSNSCMFPQLYLSTALCPMFAQLYAPTVLRSQRSMFLRFCVTTALCSPI